MLPVTTCVGGLVIGNIMRGNPATNNLQDETERVFQLLGVFTVR